MAKKKKVKTNEETIMEKETNAEDTTVSEDESENTSDESEKEQDSLGHVIHVVGPNISFVRSVDKANNLIDEFAESGENEIVVIVRLVPIDQVKQDGSNSRVKIYSSIISDKNNGHVDAFIVVPTKNYLLRSSDIIAAMSRVLKQVSATYNASVLMVFNYAESSVGVGDILEPSLISSIDMAATMSGVNFIGAIVVLDEETCSLAGDPDEGDDKKKEKKKKKKSKDGKEKDKKKKKKKK